MIKYHKFIFLTTMALLIDEKLGYCFDEDNEPERSTRNTSEAPHTQESLRMINSHQLAVSLMQYEYANDDPFIYSRELRNLKRAIDSIPTEIRPEIITAAKNYFSPDVTNDTRIKIIGELYKAHMQNTNLDSIQGCMQTLFPQGIEGEIQAKILFILLQIPSIHHREFADHLVKFNVVPDASFDIEKTAEILSKIPRNDWNAIVKSSLAIARNRNNVMSSFVLEATFEAHKLGTPLNLFIQRSERLLNHPRKVYSLITFSKIHTDDQESFLNQLEHLMQQLNTVTARNVFEDFIHYHQEISPKEWRNIIEQILPLVDTTLHSLEINHGINIMLDSFLNSFKKGISPSVFAERINKLIHPNIENEYKLIIVQILSRILHKDESHNDAQADIVRHALSIITPDMTGRIRRLSIGLLSDLTKLPRAFLASIITRAYPPMTTQERSDLILQYDRYKSILLTHDKNISSLEDSSETAFHALGNTTNPQQIIEIINGLITNAVSQINLENENI